MALKQIQPIGNPRLYDQVEAVTGQLRELRRRGRPREKKNGNSPSNPEQGKLPL